MMASLSWSGGWWGAVRRVTAVGRQLLAVRRSTPKLYVYLASLLMGLLFPLFCVAPSYAVVSHPASSTAKAPTITSFTPSSGAVGTKVVIKGTNLLKAKVTFDGKSAHVSSDSNTKITTAVPKGAKTGKIKVTTAGGSATSSTKFHVT